MASTTIFLILCFGAASLAYPTLPVNSKISDPEEGHTKDLSQLDADFGPLGVVSKALDRFTRQIASTPNSPKKWTPLHRAVLRGALQVTKQLLAYDSWTPNHLELLKGEEEILLEHVADDQGDTENRIGTSDKEEAKTGEAENPGDVADNNGAVPANNEEAAPQEPPTGQ